MSSFSKHILVEAKAKPSGSPDKTVRFFTAKVLTEYNFQVLENGEIGHFSGPGLTPSDHF